MTTENEENNSSKIDSILGCGFYQCLHYVLFILFTLVITVNMNFMVYGKVEPKFACAEWPEDRNLPKIERCSLLKNQSCTNFAFDKDFYSVVIEWELICDRAWIIYLSISIQMVGVLIGSPIFGQMSDLLGRKFTLLFCICFQTLFGAISAFSPNWQSFIALRFFIGLFTAGTMIVNFVYMVEHLSMKYRLVVGTWPLGFVGLPLIAYLTQNWRMLTLYGNLVAVPGILLLCFMQESPRWLLQKRRSKEANNSLHFVTKMNRRPTEVIPLDQLETEKPGEIVDNKKYTFIHLFYNKKMAAITIVLCVCSFSTSAMSYGLNFDLDKLSGDRYLNFFYFSVLRFTTSMATIALDYFIPKCGRRVLFIGPLMLISSFCALIAIFKIIGDSMIFTITIFMFAASVSFSPVWIVAKLSNSELYPTPVRTIADGFISTFTRIGGVVAPQLLFVGNSSWTSFPYFCFAAFGFLAVVSYFFVIPETKGKPLLDVMPNRTKIAIMKEEAVPLKV